MSNIELVRQSKRITDLFSKTSAASTTDPELQAHWARYLCILISGFLENSIELLYSEYSKKTSSPPVYRYVTKQLDRVTNPNEDVIVQIAGSFDNDWRVKLQDFLDSDGRKEAINGIVYTRNQIAHGRDTGISIVILKGYFTKAVAVIDFIEKQLGI